MFKQGGMGMICGSTMYGMVNSGRLEMANFGNPCNIFQIELDQNLYVPKYLKKKLPFTLAQRVASELFREASFGHNTVRLINNVDGPGRYVYRMMNHSVYKTAPADFFLPKSGFILIT